MVIEDLFFLERKIRERGGNVGLHGRHEGEVKFLSHKNGVSSLVFLVVGDTVEISHRREKRLQTSRLP